MSVVVCLKDVKSKTVFMGTFSKRMLGSLAVQLPENINRIYDFSGFLAGNSGLADIKFLAVRIEEKFKSSQKQKEFELEDALKSILSNKVHELSKRNRYTESGGNVLGEIIVAYGETTVMLDSQLNVVYLDSPFWAVGYGADYVLGSLHSTASGSLSPRKRIMMALAAAANFDQSVGTPFVIKQTLPLR